MQMKKENQAEHALVACHECDLVQRAVESPPGGDRSLPALQQRALSPFRQAPGSCGRLESGWADSAGAGERFSVVNLSVGGHQTHTSLFSGAIALSRAGQFGVAALVIGVLIVAPTLLFLLQIAILYPLRQGRLVPRFVLLMRILSSLSHWLMFDVFMLAIIVAVVKLSHLAQVSPGEGLWAFLGLMVASIVSITSYDLHSVWDRYSYCPARNQGLRRPRHMRRTRRPMCRFGARPCPGGWSAVTRAGCSATRILALAARIVRVAAPHCIRAKRTA